MYCYKCGSKLKLRKCEAEVWLEVRLNDRFDEKTGKKNYTVANFDHAPRCEKGHFLVYQETMDAGYRPLDRGVLNRRLGYGKWKGNDFKSLQFINPSLRDGKYLHLGRCGVWCCRTCGTEMAPPQYWCFVATAVYGSPNDPHVITLRNFRDRYLLRSRAGQNLVSAYYVVSPGVALLLRRSRFLNFVVRHCIIDIIVLLLRRLMPGARKGT